MKLREFMVKYSVTLKEMERRTGIDFRVISRYRRGQVLPSIKNAQKIKIATGGKVKLEDWVCKKLQ